MFQGNLLEGHLSHYKVEVQPEVPQLLFSLVRTTLLLLLLEPQ
jgi:hypothetical protein